VRTDESATALYFAKPAQSKVPKFARRRQLTWHIENRDEGGKVEPLVNSVEISRRPEEVFAYVTDPSHLPEWQESVDSVRGGSPSTVGSKVVVTRRIGPIERSMTSEMTELDPPKTWAVRGVDGPIRGTVKGRVEPIDGGARSRVTIVLGFEAYGIGKLLLPLIVSRQVKSEMPKNMQHLKERLESSATPS
jgi:uncharacterized protein YndB with AHSA1/START domain